MGWCDNIREWREWPNGQTAHPIIANPFWTELNKEGSAFLAANSQANTHALQRPEASWRLMFVTQPPIITEYYPFGMR